MPEPKPLKYALMVHGGAKTIPASKMEEHRRGMQKAIEAGHEVLRGGGKATDAVEASLKVLESLPAFNAGYGSALTEDREVQMDSALMDGKSMQIGAVAAIQGVWHPISVAHRIVQEESTLLVADGARKYAAEHGIELCDPKALIVEDQIKELVEKNTIGAVALDSEGNIAAGTSTGGLVGQVKGRVGDSPLAGCGFYAENGVGAVALSGDGEEIMRMRVASRIMDIVSKVGPEISVKSSIEQMSNRLGGEAGGIVLSQTGDHGWFHNSDHFAVAYVTSGMQKPAIYLTKQEEKEEQHARTETQTR